MDSSISAIISKALDGLTLRAEATAQNIANANSPNYRPVRVSFEEELASAAKGGELSIRSVEPKLHEAAAAGTSAQNRIDLELATASETAQRFGALVDVLSRELSLQRTLIRGGQ